MASPAGPRHSDEARHLLVVWHSRSGSTAILRDALLAGATHAADADVGAPMTMRSLEAWVAGPEDVLWATGVVLATPANFGYMSGALKDFFERIYHPCLERTAGLPYVVLAKGDTDVDGAVASVERIATGLRWRRALPPLTVVGAAGEADIDRATELGAAFSAGLAAGIF